MNEEHIILMAFSNQIPITDNGTEITIASECFTVENSDNSIHVLIKLTIDQYLQSYSAALNAEDPNTIFIVAEISDNWRIINETMTLPSKMSFNLTNGGYDVCKVLDEDNIKEIIYRN